MKKIWKVLRIGLLLFLSAILIFNLYIITAQIVFNKDLPKVAGFAQIIVISGSMQPDIRVGDLLFIREQEKYEKNDIVTYRSNGRLITHRLIEIDNETALAKGDANNVTDDPVPIADIEGKVVLSIPDAGNYILFLKTPKGMSLAILFVIVLYIILELPGIIGSRQSSKKT